MSLMINCLYFPVSIALCVIAPPPKNKSQKTSAFGRLSTTHSAMLFLLPLYGNPYLICILSIHLIRPMPRPRLAAVSFHAFAGRCVRHDIIRDVAGREDGSDDVAAHISPSFRCNDFSGSNPSGNLALSFSILSAIMSSSSHP